MPLREDEMQEVAQIVDAMLTERGVAAKAKVPAKPYPEPAKIKAKAPAKVTKKEPAKDVERPFR